MSTPVTNGVHAGSGTLVRLLQACAADGSLRLLDVAFARFVLELAPHSDPALLLAAALLANLEGQGHVCLPVEELPAQAALLLDRHAGQGGAATLAPASLPRDAAGWARLLGASPLIDTEPLAAMRFAAVVERADECDRHASTPMVLHGGRLYLRRYWRHERRVARQVPWRSMQAHAVDVVAAHAALARLFAPTTGAGLDWQRIACALSLRSGLTVITGGPGTGKTHTAARVLASLLMLPRGEGQGGDQPLRVALAAPTGKAAARLGQSIAAAWPVLLQQVGADGAHARLLAEGLARVGPARTLHALLGARRHTRKLRFEQGNRLPLDVLIVDEASMVHLEMMDSLLSALPDRARLVLLGDKDQLASVEAGAVLGELCHGAAQRRYDRATASYLEAVSGQRLPAALVQGGGTALERQTVMLQHSHRFGGAIHRLAAAVNAGDLAQAKSLLEAGSEAAVAWRRTGSARDVLPLAWHGRDGAAGYAAYAALVQRRAAAPLIDDDAAFGHAGVLEVLRAFDTVRVLCAVREGDWGTEAMNTAIEQALFDSGAIHRHGEWYEGRPVMVTRNDADAGVFNGDIGIVLATSRGADTFKAHFLDGGAVRSVAVGRLPPVQTAFALTVHKAQGSEFDHALLVLPTPASRVASRELVYTAVTRARSAFTLVTGKDDVLAEALSRPTLRFSGMAAAIETGE